MEQIEIELIIFFWVYYYSTFLFFIFEQGMCMKRTFDSIFEVGFGIDLDSLYGSSEEGVKYSRALIEAAVS